MFQRCQECGFKEITVYILSEVIFVNLVITLTGWRYFRIIGPKGLQARSVTIQNTSK